MKRMGTPYGVLYVLVIELVVILRSHDLIPKQK